MGAEWEHLTDELGEMAYEHQFQKGSQLGNPWAMASERRR